MGEIADAMMSGELCGGCGVYLRGKADGMNIRYCKGCGREQRAIQHAVKQAAERKCKCPTCGRKVREIGLANHIKDAHPVK